MSRACGGFDGFVVSGRFNTGLVEGNPAWLLCFCHLAVEIRIKGPDKPTC